MRPAKRVFDVVAATVGLLLLWPVFLAIAALVKAEDGGPVFFGHLRVGHRGRPFRLWKFRTMVPDAESRGLPLTVGHDPRITRVGAWLRRLKLDELPQLGNVLGGDMSFVGPRPEVPSYVATYSQEQRRVLDLMPGVTDDASIRYVNESALLAAAADPERLYVEEIVPEKIRMNLAYAARATLWTDMLVIFATLRELLRSDDGQPRNGVRSAAIVLLFVVLPVGACAAPQAAPGSLAPIAAPDSALRPGDQLRLTVWRQPEFSGDFVIGQDGTLGHPLLRTLKVSGVPVGVAQTMVRDFLKTYEQEPRLVVEALYPVVVAGEVRAPGLLNLPRGTTVAQAIARAGGPTERGRLDRVRMIRSGRTDLLDLLGPDPRIALVPVMSGDQVFVERRKESSLFRDVIGPITSFAASVAALVVALRR